MTKSSGFTLLELILVTVIIGILAGAIVVNYGGFVNKGKIATAKSDITNLISVIQTYAIEHDDQYPKALQDLVSGQRKYIRELKNDPWGNPYNYVPGTSPEKMDFKVFSSGADGAPNTKDDVTESSKHQ